MRVILIDCAKLRSRRVFHDYLEKELRLPSYYARNFESLYNILRMTNHTDAITFCIVHRERESSRMKLFFDALTEILFQLQSENPNICVVEE